MSSLQCWLQDSHVRVFPFGNAPGPRTLQLDAGRNDRLSFQVVTFNRGTGDVMRVTCQAGASDGLVAAVRRVGFVPLPHYNTETEARDQDCRGHVPGFVPDPLFEENEATVANGETAAFWVSVVTTGDCRPGARDVSVSLTCNGTAVAPLKAVVTVHDTVIRKRTDFPVTHWFYSDALLDWYRLPGFVPRYWTLAEAYMRDIAAHGQDTLYVPSLTPALDGVKRPTQLLKVARTAKGYRLDWTDVRRYLRLARRRGIRYFEWPHLFTQWGARNAIRVYEGQGADERLLWNPGTRATSAAYAEFLTPYLGQLRRLLEEEHLLDRSMFHVSDEPQGDEARNNYRAARNVLRRLAPWMSTMDALSEIAYGREKLTDMPVPIISVTRQYREEGIPCFTYFCNGPRGPWLNRLLDTPLVKVRMSGWLFYRFEVRGFLHWGYNYWYESQTRRLIDPFTESSGAAWPRWAYGDTFMVYPGVDGPIDSLRWEVFAESLSDYALLQTVRTDPKARLLEGFKDFNRFPTSLSWLRSARRRLLEERR